MSSVLFHGIGASAPYWYRCALPGLYLGADHCGALGKPGEIKALTGSVGGATRAPDFYSYEVVVLQQAHGPEWLTLVKELRAQGTRVIYEVDDYLHGIGKVEGHDFGRHYDARYLAEAEMVMRACDEMIVSTPYLAHRYRKFNERIHVCRNGLDTGRFRVTRPRREPVGIGWSGATGHRKAFEKWAPAIIAAMREHPNTYFVSIGQPFAQALTPIFGPGRALSIPFGLLEQYPAAMTFFDIALAPCGDKSFNLAKSNLRALEAGAIGVPCIADPRIYGDVIEDGANGLLAQSPQEAAAALDRLLSDPEGRERMGTEARRRVWEDWTFPRAVEPWRGVIDGTAPVWTPEPPPS